MLESKKPTIAWLDEAQQELSDAIIYLEKFKYILKEEELEQEKIGGTD